MERTVLVTGSSGYIGRRLIAALTGRYTVVGFDAVVPPVADPSVETVRFDITSDASVGAALAHVRRQHGERLAGVVHLAAFYDLSGEPSPKYQEVTVRGTERLLRELQSFEVGRFIFASTLLVHRSGEPGRPIDEDWPLDPKWPYPKSKVEAEALVHERRGRVPVAVLRLAGAYDDLCRAAFLAHQIARIYEREPTSRIYSGDADRGQPYLHLEDLVDAVLRVIDRGDSLPPEVTLLLGETETLTYRTLQETIGCLIHGEAWQTQEIPKPLAKAGVWVQERVLDQNAFIKPWMVDIAEDHFEIDISRARRLLGWEPKRSLRDSLPKIIEALKSDPPGWYRANKLESSEVAVANLEEARDKPTSEPDAVERLRREREHEARRQREHAATLWAHYTNVALGVWLIASPFAFGLFEAVNAGASAPPAAGHTLPAPEVRDALLGWSDIASGALVVLLGALSLSPHRGWARWAAAAVGTWLLFAPLVFWTPSAAAFANDTVVGALVIAFAVIVGHPPGIAAEALDSPADIPRGWTYNPSTYVQRLPIVGMAFLGFVVARYLTAVQLGHIDEARDPFFGDGTMTILTSGVSKAWPIPDGGVGAVTYLIEVLSGIAADRRRWRTMPWLVFAFGLLIVPLGAVSILFIVIQPIVIGTWCTACLITAALTVAMIPYSLDEFLATSQFMLRIRRVGRPFWRTFFRGGPALPGEETDRSPGLEEPLGTVIKNFLSGGVSYPWTLSVVTALGVWLMFTRFVFGTEGAMADSDHLVGCLVITISVTAMAEVGRAARFLNLPLGAWLVVAPFVLEGAMMMAATVGSVSAGLMLIGLSLPRGRVDGHYGGWDDAVV